MPQPVGSAATSAWLPDSTDDAATLSSVAYTPPFRSTVLVTWAAARSVNIEMIMLFGLGTRTHEPNDGKHQCKGTESFYEIHDLHVSVCSRLHLKFESTMKAVVILLQTASMLR
jgi:hypothetical protein